MEKITSVSRSALCLFLFIIISAFNPPIQHAQAGVYHLVKKNETIWSIARAYNIPVKELAKVNDIIDMNSIKEDSVLFIPSACQVIDNAEDTGVFNNKSRVDHKNRSDGVQNIPMEEKLKKEKSLTITKNFKKEDSADESGAAKVRSQKSSDQKEDPQHKTSVSEKTIGTGGNIFIWPVRGEVKACFGVQPNKTFNNWIKIVSFAGKKIKAAESGTVIFSSFLKNYGETIIIKHKNDFATVYTHVKKRLVTMDKNVKKGEHIAILGEKDDAGDVYLNFEIRMKGKAQNPLVFLP